MEHITKHALTPASTFDANNYHPVIRPHFEDVVVDGVPYKAIYTFNKYLTQGTFEHVFATSEAYNEFLKSTIWQIKSVVYDWQTETCTITLADDTVHTFPCTDEWTSKEVNEALNGTIEP